MMNNNYTSKQILMSEDTMFLNDKEEKIINEDSKDLNRNRVIKAKKIISRFKGMNVNQVINESDTMMELTEITLNEGTLPVLTIPVVELLEGIVPDLLNSEIDDSDRKKALSFYEAQLNILKENSESINNEYGDKKNKYRIMKLENKLKSDIMKLEKIKI